MIKLLITLGTISTMAPSALNMLMIGSAKVNPQENYSLDSFKSIIKIINSKNGNSQNMSSKKLDIILDGLSPEYYYKHVNGKTGNVIQWNSKVISTEIVKTFRYTYINESSIAQERLTHSETETLTESHEFSINSQENVGVKGSIKVPIAGAGVDVKFDFGLGKSWKDTKTESKEKTIPAQKTTVNPHTKAYVEYRITQEIVDNKGIAQFPINNLNEKSFRIPFLYFDKQGNFDYMTWTNYSFNEVFNLLKDWGYGSQMSSDNTSEYSIMSVDNILNPQKAFVNLPLTWTSIDPGFTVHNWSEAI